MELSNEAREARKAYRREYYRRNKEKEQQRQAAFWERKAVEMGLKDRTDESKE